MTWLISFVNPVRAVDTPAGSVIVTGQPNPLMSSENFLKSSAACVRKLNYAPLFKVVHRFFATKEVFRRNNLAGANDPPQGSHRASLANTPRLDRFGCGFFSLRILLIGFGVGFFRFL